MCWITVLFKAPCYVLKWCWLVHSIAVCKQASINHTNHRHSYSLGWEADDLCLQEDSSMRRRQSCPQPPDITHNATLPGHKHQEVHAWFSRGACLEALNLHTWQHTWVPWSLRCYTALCFLSHREGSSMNPIYLSHPLLGWSKLILDWCQKFGF